MNAIGWTERQCLGYLFPLIISISFAMDVFVPAIPMMSQFFNTTNAIMQSTLYIFMITVALAQLLVGPLADRLGRRCVTVGAAFLFLLGSLLSASAQSMSMLIVARIIQAIGSCGTYLLCFIIIRDNFSTVTCARLFSLLCGLNAMIASSAPVIGGILVDLTHDWHSTFYFLTLLGVGMSIGAWWNIPVYLHPTHTSTLQNTFNTARNILSNRAFQSYTLIASVSLLGLYLFCALSPGILITHLHLSAIQYGLWFGLNALTVFVTNITVSRMTYWLPLETIVKIGLLWMIIACTGMIILTIHHLSIIRFMIPMLVLTIGIGLSMGSATALALNDFKLQAGTATALLSSCQFGLAGLVGVIAAQYDPRPTIIALPVLLISGVAFIRNRKGKHIIFKDSENAHHPKT